MPNYIANFVCLETSGGWGTKDDTQQITITDCDSITAALNEAENLRPKNWKTTSILEEADPVPVTAATVFKVN